MTPGRQLQMITEHCIINSKMTASLIDPYWGTTSQAYAHKHKKVASAYFSNGQMPVPSTKLEILTNILGESCSIARALLGSSSLLNSTKSEVCENPLFNASMSLSPVCVCTD